MRRIKQLLMCLCATLQIQAIASYGPSSNSNLVSYSANLLKYNPHPAPQWESKGPVTITVQKNLYNMLITQHGHASPILNVQMKYVTDITQSNGSINWRYSNIPYALQFADENDAQKLTTEMLRAQHASTNQKQAIGAGGSNYQVVSNVPQGTSMSENQNGNVPVSSQLYQVVHNVQSKISYPYQVTAEIFLFVLKKWTNYGNIAITIQQNQQSNKFTIIGAALDPRLSISIEDVNDIKNLRQNIKHVDWEYDNRLYGLRFFDMAAANEFIRATQNAQNSSKRKIPVTLPGEATDAQQSHQNSGNNRLESTTLRYQIGNGLQHDPPQLNNNVDNSGPYIFDGNAAVSKYDKNQTNVILMGECVIRIEHNQHNSKYQLVAIREGDSTRIIDYVDIQDIQPIEQHENRLEWIHQNRRYRMVFEKMDTANQFVSAMNNTLRITRMPPLPAEADPSHGVNTNKDSAEPPSHHNVNVTEQPDKTRSHICTTSTENYDCQIKRDILKHGGIYNFGTADRNHQQRITFEPDSVLQNLPKSLIDAFPNMTLLNLNHLNIETIEANAFDSAYYLEHLYLEGNRLENFPSGILKNARNLFTLILSDNNISTIEYAFKSNKKLGSLFVDQNELLQLPKLDNIAQLLYFNASHNKIVEIKDNHFSKQTQIKSIDLSYNYLSYLNLQLSSNQYPEDVDVSNNQLTSLTVPLRMYRLYANNNSLPTFTVGHLCYLKQLDLANNRLNSQPNLISCYSLEYLDLSFNQLDQFELSQVADNVRFLYLSHNNLFNVSLTTPTKTNSKLEHLDLSHNKLSYLSSFKQFVGMKTLILNDNNLIAIKGTEIPKSLNHLTVSNNEWRCTDVRRLAKVAVDAKATICKGNLKLQDGICCESYANAYNDKLNQAINEANFHEQQNRDKQKEHCGNDTIFVRNVDIEQFQRAAKLDEDRAKIYTDIQDAIKNKEFYQQDLRAEKQNKAKMNTAKQSMVSAIENKRKVYRVTKEGLVSNKEMLSRVVSFVMERNNFAVNLLNQRKKSTEDTERMLDETKQEKDDLKSKNLKQAEDNTELKKQEKLLKKQMEVLQKQVNANAPAVHGKSGKS